MIESVATVDIKLILVTFTKFSNFKHSDLASNVSYNVLLTNQIAPFQVNK